MRSKYIQALVASLMIAGYATIAQAQISVSRSVIEFTKSEKVQNIEILNAGDHKVYLDLKAAEIINPESANPERVELTDPRTSPLIVSPRQLLVPPGERRRVRVILRQDATDKDQVFRLSVKPYVGSVKIDSTEGDQKASAIKVLVGYDLLLLSRPEQLNPDVSVERGSNSITFHNGGNTNVLLRKIEQCSSDGSECSEMQPNRLYAGETYKVDLPHSGGDASSYPIEVWQAVGLANKKVSY